MRSIEAKTSPDAFGGLRVRLEGFPISWAGPGRVAGETCLGSEEGELAFLAGDSPKSARWVAAVPSGEAIDGVAFTDSLMAASTRAEVTVWERPAGDAAPTRLRVLDRGAHDVIATPGGRLVASLGPAGWSILSRGPAGLQSGCLSIPRARPNVYRSIAIALPDDDELIASALRREGVGCVRLGRDHNSYRVRDLPGLDVVDLCLIGDARKPAAVALLASNGLLLLIHDIWNDAAGLSMAPAAGLGTGYRILRADRDLVMLTSDYLIHLPDLVDRFLDAGGRLDGVGSTAISRELVDAGIVGDRLLLVEPDGSLLIEQIKPIDSPSRVDPSTPSAIPGFATTRSSFPMLSLPVSISVS